MFDSIIGSIIFEFIGAFAKWLSYALINKIKGKKIIAFREIWSGRKDTQHSDLLMQGVSNIFLGIIVVMSIVIFLVKFVR